MTSRNLTNQEHIYKASINELIERADKSLIASAPMLFSNRVSVQNLITRYELFKKILNVPGDIVECGVYQGNSFCFLAHLCQILEPFSINRRLIGFDTFEGFASISEGKDPVDVSSEDFSDTSYESIKASLSALDTIRPVNKIGKYELVKGDILQTLPAYVKSHDWMTCAMLILDTDLYEPTKCALEYVLPLMPKGAVIVFDEYNYQNFPGETAAIREFMSMNKLAVRKFSYESCTAYAVVE